MADVLTKKQRSYNMAMIRGKNTGPELALRKTLSSEGIRGYRLHYKLPGRPDIVFPAIKLAIFVDGCFWHKCPKCFVRPRTRREFWDKKIKANTKRDKAVNLLLRKSGWKVLRLWEHQVRKSPGQAANRIITRLSKSR